MSLHIRGPLSKNIVLDDDADIALVYGIKITGDLLRTIGEPTPEGLWFRIVKVEGGVSTVETKHFDIEVLPPK